MSPFALVFVSIASATILAGWCGGLAALVSGQSLIWYLVFEPRHSFALKSTADAVAMAVTLLSETMVLAVVALYQSEVRAAAAERDYINAARELIVHELSHRVKNTLAVVQSLATQTFRGSAQDKVAAFQSRIKALASAHDLIARESLGTTNIRHLVEMSVAPYRPEAADRISADGPPIDLPASMAINLALALNELATNATKYGSLSGPGGTVKIFWVAENSGGLALQWIERGGPLVAAPKKRGFGIRMIEMGVAAQSGGKAEIDFSPEGLSCLLRAPIPTG